MPANVYATGAPGFCITSVHLSADVCAQQGRQHSTSPAPDVLYVMSKSPRGPPPRPSHHPSHAANHLRRRSLKARTLEPPAAPFCLRQASSVCAHPGRAPRQGIIESRVRAPAKMFVLRPPRGCERCTWPPSRPQAFLERAPGSDVQFLLLLSCQSVAAFATSVCSLLNVLLFVRSSLSVP